ncbi:MAG: hypothetical protein R3E79_34020 [Caldilineaceae bacterium]
MLHGLADSAAVFSGTVIKKEQPDAYKLNGMYVSVETVAVTKMWKGPTNTTLMIANHMCSYPFQVGKEYLIFAREIEGQLVADSCNRTQPIETAASDIAVLNTLFDPSVAPAVRPATVTARGYSSCVERADYFGVYFHFAQVRADEVFSDTQRAAAITALAIHEISAEMLNGGPSIDASGLQFSSRWEQLPQANVAAFLAHLVEAQADLSTAIDIPIAKVEVRFTFRDCTQIAWAGQRSAVADARLRAEVLAGVLSSRVGAITELIDLTAPQALAPGEFVQCGAIKVGKWHELPLKVSLEAARLLRFESTVQVTYALEAPISGVQKPLVRVSNSSELVATPAPPSVSPLPTPSSN